MVHTTIEFQVPENELYSALEKGLKYLTDMASPKDTINPEMSNGDVMRQMLMGINAAETSPNRTKKTVEYLRQELESGKTEASKYLDNTYGRSEKVDVSVTKLPNNNYKIDFRAIHLRAIPGEVEQDLVDLIGHKGTVTE